jgi:hypothetical protein
MRRCPPQPRLPVGGPLLVTQRPGGLLVTGGVPPLVVRPVLGIYMGGGGDDRGQLRGALRPLPERLFQRLRIVTGGIHDRSPSSLTLNGCAVVTARAHVALAAGAGAPGAHPAGPAGALPGLAAGGVVVVVRGSFHGPGRPRWGTGPAQRGTSRPGYSRRRAAVRLLFLPLRPGRRAAGPGAGRRPRRRGRPGGR